MNADRGKAQGSNCHDSEEVLLKVRLLAFWDQDLSAQITVSRFWMRCIEECTYSCTDRHYKLSLNKNWLNTLFAVPCSLVGGITPKSFHCFFERAGKESLVLDELT